MTAPRLASSDLAADGRALSRSIVAGGIVALGCAALAARPVLAGLAMDQTVSLLVLFTGLLAVGMLWPVAALPLPARRTSPASVGVSATVAIAVAVGIGAFLIGRAVAGAHSAGPLTVRFVLLNAFAAVAEEAFFRRFVYGILEPQGTGVAVVGSAVLFAGVHLTVYGPWVLPIDLAAGLLFGWQRAATGSWKTSAVTHVAANVLAVL